MNLIKQVRDGLLTYTAICNTATGKLELISFRGGALAGHISGFSLVKLDQYILVYENNKPELYKRVKWET